jgi:ubiquinone/menaquinone biosynthesis C-methylase UbiE
MGRTMFDVSDTAYDNFMGRYSMQLGPAFADFAGVQAGWRVLDVGAGTGALTVELVRRGVRAAAVDPSPSFAASLARRLPDVEVEQGPAEDLPWPEASFDASLAQLVLTFMNDAPRGVAEMRRVVRPGGVVAACMWDRDGMEMLAAVHRTQRALAAGGETTEARTAYRSREEIEGLFAGDGFADVQTELLEVEAEYSGFDEFWATFGGGAGPAGVWMKELSDDRRAAARDELHRQVGSPAGRFTLRGRAWATRATRA